VSPLAITYLVIALVGLAFLALTVLIGEIADIFDVGDDGIGPFNGKVIAVALTAFGATGLLMTFFRVPVLWGALAAAGSGLAFGLAAWLLVALLYRQQATTEFSLQDLLGRTGEVTVPIAADQPGYVVISGPTGTRQYLARSSRGIPIPAGQLVRVSSLAGTVLLVEPLQPATLVEGPDARGETR
jgi:membrane protein implicated in regulation of membrane protease activity